VIRGISLWKRVGVEPSEDNHKHQVDTPPDFDSAPKESWQNLLKGCTTRHTAPKSRGNDSSPALTGHGYNAKP
jgi:hypothetical protein